MKLLFATLLFSATTSIAIAAPMSTTPSPYVSPSLISSVASFSQLPAVKGRKGSHRVGGYNSHGKGSRYVGGRK